MMRVEEVASLLLASSDTEPELNLSLSQSSTQSTQDGSAQQPPPAVDVQQPQPPPAIGVVHPQPQPLPATVVEQPQPPPATVVVEKPQPAIVLPQEQQPPSPHQIVVVVPPEVGAVQEVEPPSEQEEEEATSVGDLFPLNSPRERRVSASSSSQSIPSDDLDTDWQPQLSAHSKERHPKKTMLGKRKFPGRLELMEVDVGEQDTAGDKDGSDTVIITSVIPGAEDVETNIFTLSRNAAMTDEQVPRITPTHSTPTVTPAPIFSTAKARQHPTSSRSATSTEGGSGSTRTELSHSEIPQSSSPSGIGSGSSSSYGRRQKFTSPVWDFFTVHPVQENIAVCTICHANVSRGKLGTNYGTGGQTTHLKKTHVIRWENHLASLKNVSTRVGGDTVVQGPLMVDQEVEEEGDDDLLSRSGTQSTPVASTGVVKTTSSASATSQWHQSQLETPRSAKSAMQGGPSSTTQRHAKQLTIPSMLRQEGKYERNHPVARLYNAKLAKMLALDLLPFSFVEAVGFLELVATLCPKWNVPSRYYFARVAVPALHHDVLELIGKALQQSVVHCIHLTTDMWSSCDATDFMCITAHWISFAGVKDKLTSGLRDVAGIFNDTRRHATIAMFGMDKSHTAENILSDFNDKVFEWLKPRGLKIGFVSTDNGSNVVKAMREGHYIRVPCLAHCINLVVQDFLKNEAKVSNIMAICRRICTHFNHSFKGRKLLRVIQQEHRLPVKALIQEVPTRWNSTYFMLERLFEQYIPLNAYVMSRRLGDPTVNLKALTIEMWQWDLIKCITEMLQPFEVFTRAVSREDCTMGQAIPLLYMLEQQVKEVCETYEGDEQKVDAYTLAKGLVNRLCENVRLNNIVSGEHYITATILDPRYKLFVSSNEVIPFSDEDVDKYKTSIAAEANELETERLLLKGLPLPAQASPSTPDASSSQRESSASAFQQAPTVPKAAPTRSDSADPTKSITAFFLQKGMGKSVAVAKGKEDQQSRAPMNIERMVQAYLDDTTEVFMEQSPLVYWYERRRQWPVLSRLAIKYLACPVASVSSERVFSAAGAIVTSKRTSLSPKSVERLTMIKMNQRFIPPDYQVRESPPDEESECEEDVLTTGLHDLLLSERTEFEDELLFPDN
ncbi:zinc finger BED domain-containing protein 6-like [Lissotriton helveticus]